MLLLSRRRPNYYWRTSKTPGRSCASLLTLRFNKDTYVISQSHNPTPPIAFPPGATRQMRFQDNAEIEEFLRLKRYIRFNPSEHPGAGDSSATSWKTSNAMSRSTV